MIAISGRTESVSAAVAVVQKRPGPIITREQTKSRVVAVSTRTESDSAAVAVVQKRPGLISTHEQKNFSAVKAGLRGAKGESGQTFPPVAFAFGDASPRLLHILTDSALLVSVQLIIATTFNGNGASLRIRTQTGAVLLDSDQVAPDFSATYESTPGVSLAAGTGIYLEITPGEGATAGSGFVVLNLN